MRLGLSDLMVSHESAALETTRSFYERRGVGRGPSNAQELNEFRRRLSTASRAVPEPWNRRVVHGGRSVSVRQHGSLDIGTGLVLLDLHGGGFYAGSAADNDVRNRELSDRLNIAVISVDYRLSPEHPWPAAVDDCETAALWLLEVAQREFGTERLVISGFSAGSTLAVATLLRLRDRHIGGFTGAVLQCGTYDLSGRTPAGRLIADEYFLDAYAGNLDDRTNPDFSPIYADLSALPPALMVVGEKDILLADNLAMAARLSADGVEVDLRVYPESPHGFTGHQTPIANTAREDIATRIGGHLA